MDVFGEALRDFYQGDSSSKLWIHNTYGEPEEMPVEVFFRSEADLSDLEHNALNLCKGRILDIGAGAGAHSLILQSLTHDITALELSEEACEIMRKRGINKVINVPVLSYAPDDFDTLLLLMNGIGLCGSIAGLHTLLSHLKSFLKPGGQILFDSSDITYLFEEEELPVDNYYGEIAYQYEYKGSKSEWFKWLYIDMATMKTIAEKHGLICEILYEDDWDQYLARLTLTV
jgi:SAM-dependent methyltransferase